MNQFNFTIRSVEALPAKGTRAVYRDRRVSGLGLVIQVSGVKSFFWQRKVNGYPRWETIGQYPDLTIDQARDKATELNNTLAKWKASGFEGTNPFERHGALTLGGVLDLYVEQHLKQHALRPELAEKNLRRMFKAHLSP